MSHTLLSIILLGATILPYKSPAVPLQPNNPKPKTAAFSRPHKRIISQTRPPVAKKKIQPKKKASIQIVSPKIVDSKKAVDVASRKIPPAVNQPTNSQPTSTSDQPSSSALSRSLVIQLTNQARDSNGQLPALKENQLLNTVAQERLKDMFDNQYFAHTSPTGVSPFDLASKAGYAYRTMGENIALGDYQDNEALVDSWMDSPGHRKNILDSDYQEIGVAVGKGMYRGREVWIGVQIFAKPLN